MYIFQYFCIFCILCLSACPEVWASGLVLQMFELLDGCIILLWLERPSSPTKTVGTVAQCKCLPVISRSLSAAPSITSEKHKERAKDGTALSHSLENESPCRMAAEPQTNMHPSWRSQSSFSDMYAYIPTYVQWYTWGSVCHIFFHNMYCTRRHFQHFYKIVSVSTRTFRSMLGRLP